VRECPEDRRCVEVADMIANDDDRRDDFAQIVPSTNAHWAERPGEREQHGSLNHRAQRAARESVDPAAGQRRLGGPATRGSGYLGHSAPFVLDRNLATAVGWAALGVVHLPLQRQSPWLGGPVLGPPGRGLGLGPAVPTRRR